MFGIGWPEMMMIFIVALIALGPKKIPELAKSLGRAMAEFRKAAQEFKESLAVEEDLEELKKNAADAVSGIKDLVHEATDSVVAPEEEIREGSAGQSSGESEPQKPAAEEKKQDV